MAIVWLQKDASEKVFKAIGEDLSHIKVTLEDLGFERHLKDVDNDEQSVDEIGTALCKVDIGGDSDDSDDNES